VFDALTSRRPYKEPMSFRSAMDILEQSRGTHFDPKLLDTFAGIAGPLHNVFANRDDEHPRQVLRDIVIRYFKQDIAALL
jgi:HD-GYP domain-containing protein (c-di-GMP phosphodiesterase class II)